MAHNAGFIVTLPRPIAGVSTWRVLCRDCADKAQEQHKDADVDGNGKLFCDHCDDCGKHVRVGR